MDNIVYRVHNGKIRAFSREEDIVHLLDKDHEYDLDCFTYREKYFADTPEAALELYWWDLEGEECELIRKKERYYEMLMEIKK